MSIRTVVIIFILNLLVLIPSCGREYNNPIDPEGSTPIPPVPKKLELFSVPGEKKIIGRFEYDFRQADGLVIERSSFKDSLNFVKITTLEKSGEFIDTTSLSFDKEYVYRMFAFNKHGTSIPSTHYFVHTAPYPDTIGPIIKFLSPITVPWYTDYDSANFKLSINDQSKISKVVIGGVIAKFDSTNNSYYSNVELQYGINRIVCEAYDIVGNISMITADSIFYDTTLMDWEAPHVMSVYTNGKICLKDSVSVEDNLIRLSGFSSDESGIKNVYVNGVLAQVSDSFWSADIIIKAGIWNLISISVTDNSHNKNNIVDSLYIFCNLDGAPPKLTILIPADSSIIIHDSVIISGLLSDASGIFSVTVNGRQAVFNDSQWTIVLKNLVPEDLKPFIVEARDKSQIMNITRDTIFISYDPTYIDSLSPNLSDIKPSSGDTLTSPIFTLSGMAHDQSGIRSVLVNNQNASLNGVYWSWKSDTLIKNNWSTFLINATDYSSRRNSKIDSVKLYYLFDDKAPQLSITSHNAESTLVSSKNITLSGKVQDFSGIRIITVQTSKATVIDSLWSYTLTIDAYKTWRKVSIISIDNSPQKNKDTIVKYFYWDSTINDRTPPYLSLTSHKVPYDTVGSTIINLSGKKYDKSGIAKININGKNVSITEDSMWTLPSFLLNAVKGSERFSVTPITIIVEDLSYFKNSDTIMCNIVYDTLLSSQKDVKGPVFSVLYNASQLVNGTILPDSIQVYGSVSDPSGISSFTLSVNGGNDIVLERGVYSKILKFNSYTNTLKFTATDSIGNTSIQSIVVKADFPFQSSKVQTDTGNGKIRLSWNSKQPPDFSSYSLWIGEYADVDTIKAVKLFESKSKQDTIYEYTPVNTRKIYSFILTCYDSLGNSLTEPAVFRSLHGSIDSGMKHVTMRNKSYQMGQKGLLFSENVHNVNFTYNIWVDSTEVTLHDYFRMFKINPQQYNSDTLLPITGISWFDALLYCNARSKRDGFDTVYSYTSALYKQVSGIPNFGERCTLLTNIDINTNKVGYRLLFESEWEYCCRAGTTTKYYWGNIPDGAYAWYYYNAAGMGAKQTATRLPNAYNLYDMSGNAYEMCNDRSKMEYDTISQTDPTGPDTCTSSEACLKNFRIIRSGGTNSVDGIQSAARLWMEATEQNAEIGFRVCLPNK